MYFYIPFVILAGLRLLFVSFPAVICAKREAYHGYKISYLVKMAVHVHYVCSQLRQACVADYCHNEKSRAALCLVAKSLKGH